MLKMGGGALPPAFKPEEGHERRKTGRRLAGAQRLPGPNLRFGPRPQAANAAPSPLPYMKKDEAFWLRLLPFRDRQRHTLPGRLQPSTICAKGLNFCVRHVYRWFPFAFATGNIVSESPLLLCLSLYCSLTTKD